MVSEETQSTSLRESLRLSGTRPYVLLDSFDNLESELALLRDSIDNLRLHNCELLLEVGVLSGEVSTLNERLDALDTASRATNEDQDQPVAAQPVEPEDRPLQIGDRVRITSRQHFGTEGTIHSFTNERVRIQIEGRRRPIIRAANNIQRIPN